MKVQGEMENKNQMFSISEDILREISDNCQIGVSIVENGLYIFMNKKFKEIYGINEEEENRNFSILDYVVNADAGRVYKIINSSLITDKMPTELHFWIIRGDGERRYLNNKYKAFKGREIAITHLILTTDCTEQKRTTAALEDRNKISKF